LEILFSDLIDGPLPTGSEWMDHLDLLDAIRINPISGLKPFKEYYPNQMPGYLAAGAPIGSPVLPFIIGGKPIFGPYLLVPHELRAGYLRFAVASTATLMYTMSDKHNLRATLIKQAEDKLGFGIVDPELVEPFLERLRQRPTLAKVEAWWGQI